jgi:hypothetical protein
MDDTSVTALKAAFELQLAILETRLTVWTSICCAVTTFLTVALIALLLRR